MGSDVEHFVQGLHIIELKYDEMTGEGYSFGSPSPSYKVIEYLRGKEPDLAGRLQQWIAENGGNNYIDAV